MFENSVILVEYRLSDERTVKIKRLLIKDYEKNNNYKYVHDWLHKVNKYLLGEFEEQNLEQDKKYFYDFLSKKDENFLLGAIYNGKIIASVGISVNLGIKKTRHVGNWGISIHPDFHNQGLGKRLLMLMEKIAKESGLKKLEAEFFEGNKISEHLYVKKLGYKIEGRRKYAALLKDNTYVDRIMIGKKINESLKGKK